MSDYEAQFRSWWCDFRDGRLSLREWQALLRDTPGLQKFVRLEREREMSGSNQISRRRARREYLRGG